MVSAPQNAPKNASSSSQLAPDSTDSSSPSAGRAAVGHPIDVASGNQFHELEDYVIPGRIPLVWSRRYSAALRNTTRPGIFGPSWSSPVEQRLWRDLDGYSFLGADGETKVAFDDPQALVEQSGVLRNLGAFCELTKDPRDGSYVVSKWSAQEHEVERFRFVSSGLSDEFRLASHEQLDGNAVDFHYDPQGRVSRLIQRREGRGFVLTYNDRGCVTEVRLCSRRPQAGDGQGRLLYRYVYDEKGWLREAFDALDQRSAYDYDDRGLLIREVMPGGMVYHFRYDGEGRCLESVGLDGFARTQLRYDRTARLTQVTNSLDQITTYVCNSRGQVEQEISPLGNKQTSEYDEHGRLLRSISPSGSVTGYEYDQAGNLCAETDPNGAVTRFEHDAVHRLVAIVDPAGFRWERRFDERGLLSWVINPLGQKTSYSYAASGDVIARRSPLGHEWKYGWDIGGNLETVTDPQGATTRHSYDQEGLLVSITEPPRVLGQPGAQTLLLRDPLGRVREVRFSDGATRKFGYHPTDQITQFVDENGDVTRWRYLACGFLAEEVKPLGHRIQYLWNSEPGQLASIVNERGERYSFAYDPEGRVIEEIDFGGRQSSYEYDRDGNVCAAIDSAARKTKFRRGKKGELLAASYSDGSQVSLRYDARGLVVEARNPSVTVEREYDSLGRLVCEAQVHGEQRREVRSEYDADGRRVKRSSSLGYEVLFAWNPADQLETLHPQGQSPLHFEYSPDGFERARYVPGGTRIECDYDARGRLVAQAAGRRDATTGRVAVGGPAAVRRSYRYDPVGNLLEQHDDRWGTTRYGYDKNGRITSRVDVGRWSETFDYDPTDNLRSVSEYKSDFARRLQTRSERLFSYRPGNQLERSGDTVYEYDAVGQQTKKSEPSGCTRYEWNAQGMLARVVLPSGEVWHYTYDAFARRVEKRGPSGSTQFVWDGDVVLHEVRQTESATDEVVHWEFEPGGFVPIGKIERQKTFLCVNEINGAPRELLDVAGKPVWSVALSTYGEATPHPDVTATTNCPIRFQGQWFDEETGLHYNRFRYYISHNCVFISQDPLKRHGNVNTYSYAKNQKWIDPLGLILVYRGMKSDGNTPVIEESARGLGARPNIDVTANSNGIVMPGVHGISVAPNKPENLPTHRRSAAFGGTGRDPVWHIDTSKLAPDLRFVPDPTNPKHGFIAPARAMSLAEYQLALKRTQRHWKKTDDCQPRDG